MLLAQVDLEPFRADFVLASNFGPDVDTMPWVIAVELDGHEFHERTKHQARRDRSRDRFMTAHDIKVLRFTGSEVWHDAYGCALEAMKLATRLQQRNMDRHFERWIEDRVAAGDIPPTHGSEES